MKKIIVTLSLILACTFSVNAQSVYRELRKMSQETYKKTMSEVERSVAKFRLAALDYMGVMTSEQMKDSASITLDMQSYELFEFTETFIKASKRIHSKSALENLRQTFKIVSLEYPRFNEMDADVALRFINEKPAITPFCLNTDWVKATKAIRDRGFIYE